MSKRNLSSLWAPYISDRTGRATMERLGRPIFFQLNPQSNPTLDGSVRYRQACLPSYLSFHSWSHYSHKVWWTCFEMLHVHNMQTYYILNHNLIFHNNHRNLTYPNMHSNTHQHISQHTLKHTWVSINKSPCCRRSCTYLITMSVM